MRYSNLTIAGAAVALMMSTAPAAFAAGTTALTAIESTVNISFSRGSAQVDLSESVTFYVDRKVDLLAESQHSGNVTVDLGTGTFTEELRFNFENKSNAAVDFVISVDAPSGFSEDASGGEDTFYVTVDGNAYGVGDTITFAADAAPVIRVIAEFAADTNANRTFTVNVNPTSDFNEVTGRDILAGGAANMNTIWLFDSADTSASATFAVASPTLTASKAVAVVSQDASFDCADGTAPGGAQAAIPGACIEYTITVNNTGGAAMRNLVIEDVMPSGVSLAGIAGVSFEPSGFFSVGHGSLGSNGVRAVAQSNLTNGGSATLRIRATID